MSEWKPIETAPRDDTPILVSDGEDVQCSQFTNDRWCQSPLAWEGSDDQGGLVSTYFDPTHWMRLPSAPAAKVPE